MGSGRPARQSAVRARLVLEQQHRFGAPMHAELREHAVNVVLDSGQLDAEPAGDHLVGHALAQELEDLRFACREGGGGCEAGLTMDFTALVLTFGAETGLTTYAVDPGDMRTPMHQNAFPGEDIADRPLPEVTLPFWAWLFGQPRAAVNGRRYLAQADRFEVNAEALGEVAA